MKFYTYEEYLRHNQISNEERYEQCENCNGTGECQCACGNSHDCNECNSTGKIDTEIEEYYRKKEEQRKKYEEWQNWAGK